MAEKASSATMLASLIDYTTAPAIQFLQPKLTIAQRIKIVAPTKDLKGFPSLTQTGFISLGGFSPGRGGIPGAETIFKPIKEISSKRQSTGNVTSDNKKHKASNRGDKGWYAIDKRYGI